jgi:SnoaL-like domain
MGLSRDEILDLVDALYDATGTGDFDAAADMLTEDFIATEANGLPMAGVYRGRNALRDLYLKVMGLLDVAGLSRGETTIGENLAICHVTLTFADPALPPADLLELIRFRNGKVCEIKPYYFDPAPVLAASAAKAAA